MREEPIRLKLPVDYKPQEIAELAIEAARVRRDKGKVEDQKSATVQKLNQRIKELEEELNPLDNAILDGFTLEDVACIATFDTNDKVTKVTRKDTGKEVTGVQQVRLNLPMAKKETLPQGPPAGSGAPKGTPPKKSGKAPADPSKPLTGKGVSDKGRKAAGNLPPSREPKPDKQNKHTPAPAKPGRVEVLAEKCTVCGGSKVKEADGTVHCMKVPKHTEMEELR